MRSEEIISNLIEFQNMVNLGRFKILRFEALNHEERENI